MSPGIAEEALAALHRHVLEPLGPRCVDSEYGGFLVDFDERWRPIGPHDKTLEHASRTTMAFALAARTLPGSGCAELVRHGCAFLQSAFWDATHGGFFARVDRSGRPSWDGLKHPHAITYAAQAFILAAPYLAPDAGRSWAQRALEWLDDVSWDRIHGGYWGSFRRNNERYPDGARLPTSDGRDVVGVTPGLKEINTLGDSIEMLTTLVAHGIDEPCVERLARLVHLVTVGIAHPRGALPYLYSADWQTVPDLVRVGQQFQLVHRLLAASAITGDTKAATTSRELAEFCLTRARHPSGGFCHAVSGDGRVWPSAGPSSDLRQWWVQLEAARAFHALATHEAIGEPDRTRYAGARDEQWVFIREHYFDTRFGGIWALPREAGAESRSRLLRWLRAKPSEPRPLRKTHGWKDPLHEVATFLAIAGASPCPSLPVA